MQEMALFTKIWILDYRGNIILCMRLSFWASGLSAHMDTDMPLKSKLRKVHGLDPFTKIRPFGIRLPKFDQQLISCQG
ncbi:hypothetical protein KP509_03G037900 [Ceratopteris richardii]|uniref:Uncharacterized protein n=1 Tax=Ceratopteris richardii TaxID=49495 RepID=A0A8T2V6E4_CERRI|nr:hypothetical protein KP509_03G037900 [Ceratopteris richardii]